MTAPPVEASTPTTARIDGRDVVSFGGCNYLGLAQHPRVCRAAADAIARFGLSASASRETTGNTRAHQDLETELAAFCGYESGLLVPDGYIANLAALQGLAAQGFRHAVVDARAHASLRDAAGMGGMRVTPFDHLDADDAGTRLRACDGPAAVLTDSVFAADGAVAPARELLAALRPGDRLLLDDCHGFAVLGRQGRGVGDELGLPRDRVVLTTTLAKGLGCGGGIVMGSREYVATARARSTAYVCTTPTSPILASAGLEALRVLHDEPTLHARLRDNARAVRGLLRSSGIDCGDMPTPVVAFTTGDPPTAEGMRALHRAALADGVLLPLVEYPGGPAPAYFRLSVSAMHTDEQIALLAGVLRRHAGLVHGERIGA